MILIEKLLPYLLAVVLVLTFFLALGNILDAFAGCPRDLVAQAEGVPIIKAEPIPANRLGIQQIAESSERIYLLHQKYCIVSVYNKNGEYAYTISVYSHKNGIAYIAVVQDKLHLLDKNQNLYVFNDDRLVMFSKYENSAALRNNIDFEVQSSMYFRKGSNIYAYADNGDEQPVIVRPWYLSVFQLETTLELVLHVAYFIVGAAFVFLSRYVDKHKKSSM